jgi:hypothetical protein
LFVELHELAGVVVERGSFFVDDGGEDLGVRGVRDLGVNFGGVGDDDAAAGLLFDEVDLVEGGLPDEAVLGVVRVVVELDGLVGPGALEELELLERRVPVGHYFVELVRR